MVVKKIGSLILYATDLKKTVEFYNEMGLKLEIEKHEDGPIHYTSRFEGNRFDVYKSDENGKATPRRKGGAMQFGLIVDDVDKVYEHLLKFDTNIIWKPDNFPWGRAAMLEDPDGRAVEIFNPNNKKD